MCIICIGFILLIIAYLMGKRYYNGGKCNIKADLKNKIILITGGSKGIGRQTTLELLKMGAHIVIASRNNKRTEEFINQIKAQNKDAQVDFLELDLADTKSIRSCAQQFKSKYNRLDILINNAGVMIIPKRRLTKDGFEEQLGINHLGHFLLTNLLLDVIKASQPSRIISVSSCAHVCMFGERGKVDFDDIMAEKSYSPARAYAQSKLCNILFTKELQRRLDKENANVRCVCLHPGSVRTELGDEYWNQRSFKDKIIAKINYPYFYLITKSVFYGCQTSVYLAAEKHENLVKGGYYADCKLTQSTPESQNTEVAQKLWVLSEQLVKLN